MNNEAFPCHFETSSREKEEKRKKRGKKKKKKRGKKRRIKWKKEENKKTTVAFLYHFDADSRKQGMRQKSDLRVVTAPNDAGDDEDAQNGKEKSIATIRRI
ncbi:MAG: hypothetical protein ACOX8U_09435 [Bradymonadia bacterium]|jgi:hypothetical protein